MATSAGTTLRDARVRAGLTQAELARRAGVPQSVVSAYESGRRQPSLPTLTKLVSATGFDLQLRLAARAERMIGPLGQRLRNHRSAVRAIARQHGASNVRVFGSVARGEEGLDSDVDLLVDLPDDAGLLTIGRLAQALEDLLGARVDVVPYDGLKADVRSRVDADLVPL